MRFDLLDRKLITPFLLGGFFLAIISIVILLVISTSGARAYGLLNIQFEPLDHLYNLTVDDQRYHIRYGFSSDRNGTAVMESMSADYPSKSIKIEINDSSTSTAKKFFIIELPRN